MNQQQLTKQIMMRVRIIYALQVISSPLSLKIILFALSAAFVSSLVSIKHVVLNISQLPEVTESMHYLVDAFIHTRLSVQIGLMCTALFFVLLAGEIGKNLLHRQQIKFS